MTVPDLTAHLPAVHDVYHLAEELGRGGFGVVHRGKPREGGRDVAIKLPHFDAALVEPARILREARLLEELRHPNLVDFLGLYQTVSGQLALVYELVQGPGLDELIDGRPLEPDRARQLLQGIAAGLEHLHAAGLVHRDLKSENILVAPRLTPKLLDFGLLRPAAPGATLTATGVIAGTPEFSAPEIFDGHPATVRSDLYSLGCLAFEMFYGELPYQGGIIDVMYAHRQGKPPTFPPAARQLPLGLADAFEVVLARDPAERPARAHDLVTTLVSALDGGPRTATPTVVESVAPSRELTRPGALPPGKPFPWKLPALGLAAVLAAIWAMRPVPGSAPGSTPGPAPEVSPQTPTAHQVAGLPADFPARYAEDLRAIQRARFQGLEVADPNEENTDAPLAVRNPLVWGRLRRRGSAIQAFDAWLDEGGRPDQLPEAWLAELRELERRYEARNLPPSAPPLFPHLDLAPAATPVAIAPLVAAWPELEDLRASMSLPDEATGWLGMAYAEAAEAFRRSDEAEADWRNLVQSGTSRLGLPLPLGLRTALAYGVAKYSKYLDGVWESQTMDTRAQFSRALLPASQALHRATVALARATAEAGPEQRGAVARLAYLALSRLGALGSRSYLASLTPEDQLPRFEGPAYFLLASLPAERLQTALQVDQGGGRGLEYLLRGLDAIDARTPTELATRLRGEFLVRGTKEYGMAKAEVRERLLPEFRVGPLAEWVRHGATGLQRLATAVSERRGELAPTKADLERLVTGLEALGRTNPEQAEPALQEKLRRLRDEG